MMYFPESVGPIMRGVQIMLGSVVCLAIIILVWHLTPHFVQDATDLFKHAMDCGSPGCF